MKKSKSSLKTIFLAFLSLLLVMLAFHLVAMYFANSYHQIKTVEDVNIGGNSYCKVVMDDGSFFITREEAAPRPSTSNWQSVSKSPVLLDVQNNILINLKNKHIVYDTAKISMVAVLKTIDKKIQKYEIIRTQGDYYQYNIAEYGFDIHFDNGFLIKGSPDESFSLKGLKNRELIFSLSGDIGCYKSIYGMIKDDYFKNLSINFKPKKVSAPQRIVKKYQFVEIEENAKRYYYLRMENGDIIDMSDTKPNWLWDISPPNSLITYDDGGKNIKLVETK